VHGSLDYNLEAVGTRVYDEVSGCVEVQTILPVASSILRVDQTDYNITDDGTCVKTWDPTDSFDCSMTELAEGVFQATAYICEVEKHTWAGWRLDELMKDGRFGYFTVYFSQGDEWTHIGEHCIQADKITEINIDATSKESVEIACVRKDDCPMGPTTTIQLPDRGLCSSYWSGALACDVESLDGISTYKTTLTRPADGQFSFVTCSTQDAFMEYVVDWGV